jgi:two-component system response regulator AtoC
LPELLDALQRLDWPGNVRQLENAVARLLALSAGGPIGLEALVAQPVVPAACASAEAPPEDTPTLREQIEAVERNLIGQMMAAVGGNQSEAARRLGLNRGSLIERLRKYGLAGRDTDLRAAGRSCSNVSSGSTPSGARAAA